MMLDSQGAVAVGNPANKKAFIIINPPAALFHRNLGKSKNMKNIGNRRREGFTLVEIMIVVAIIGLLAAIGIPNFVRARQTSQTNACINNLRVIDQAKQQWALETGQLSTAVPGISDVVPFFGRSGTAMPTEPVGGSYNILAINIPPTCSKFDLQLHNAVLPF